MRARPRRAALGLRGRIVGAVMLCTVATLAVAAIALLGPLEHSLRSAAETTLKNDLGHDPTRAFQKLDLTDLPFARINAKGAAAKEALDDEVDDLSRKIGGTAYVVGYPDIRGDGTQLAPPVAQSAGGGVGSAGDVVQALLTGAGDRSFGSVDGIEYAQEALPFTNGDPRVRYVLAVRKPIDEIPGAVHAVRQAFLYAVLAGLALSLLMGVPLAARLVRRLRELRVSALKIADGGLQVELPEDRVRDEVGDLGRSFAVMQRRLHHQEEARRAFVATASHELRTPLTSLEGMLELLDDDLQHGTPDLQDARALLASARAQSRRLGRLAGDLLDLSRIDAEVKLRSEPIELGELCRAVIAEFDLGTRARGVRAGLEEHAGSIWALGDPGSVARILRILLDNAVRVSPAGTEVTVELTDDPLPQMSVRDRGPGVDDSERELIFERFHRGRATGGDAGFGLGLAIGRELAERMGGTLVFEAPDGAGARFTLTLPAARAAAEDQALTV